MAALVGARRRRNRRSARIGCGDIVRHDEIHEPGLSYYRGAWSVAARMVAKRYPDELEAALRSARKSAPIGGPDRRKFMYRTLTRAYAAVAKQHLEEFASAVADLRAGYRPARPARPARDHQTFARDDPMKEWWQ